MTPKQILIGVVALFLLLAPHHIHEAVFPFDELIDIPHWVHQTTGAALGAWLLLAR